eukprot:3975401-Pyramimonas_sp.AAC.1
MVHPSLIVWGDLVPLLRPTAGDESAHSPDRNQSRELATPKMQKDAPDYSRATWEAPFLPK